jgi:23S rRNA (cytosine1962-C5)-methyltransferase
MSIIVFEDEHLLVINKPAGWNTHAPAPYAGEGVYDWLKHREPRWARLAIIHRLDKETSGVMVFGKTPEANRSLTEQFASRAVRKKYLLLTDGTVPKKQFTAVSTIVRAGEKYLSRPLRSHDERAETQFTVLRHEGQRTLVQAEPVTGRTHQIRVHAAEHGFPILGDGLYGGSEAPRVFLHAAVLAIKHPATGEALTLRAECGWDDGHADMAVRAPIELRAVLIEPAQTNVFRLVHGASDRWPELFVEKLGDFLLAQSGAVLSPPQRELLETLAREHRARGVYHKLLNRDVRRSGREQSSPQLVFGEPAPGQFTILENGLTFEMSFNEGYSVGLFLDQRDNRRRFLMNHVAADFPLWPDGLKGAHVLNTFAYTCGFSVAAAKAGAVTTSLDLSKKYLEWGKRNFALNQLDPSEHDFIYGDTFDWMRRLAKKGRLFEIIVLDPPTFSQSKESGVWQAEKHYEKLVSAALPLLKPEGVLLASTNAAGLDPEKFLEMISAAVGKCRRRILQRHYVPQPPDFPVSRAEPAYLKTVWLRIAGAHGFSG